MKNTYRTNEKVRKQEIKTRNYCKEFFPSIFGKQFKRCLPTDIKENVDFNMTAGTDSYDVEVKMLKHKLSDLQRFGGCGITSKKHILIKNYNKASGRDKLIYMNILFDAVVIYDFSKVDLNQVEYFLWREKKTEFDDESEWLDVPAFKIPLAQAVKIYKINNSKWYQNGFGES